MKNVVKWFDNLPLWAKVVFALPFLDLAWAIYRVVKGVDKNKISLIIIGIIWIVLGWIALWVIDIISLIIHKDIKILSE